MMFQWSVTEILDDTGEVAARRKVLEYSEDGQVWTPVPEVLVGQDTSARDEARAVAEERARTRANLEV